MHINLKIKLGEYVANLMQNACVFAPDENLWFVACRRYIIIYRLIAKATITFSKQNGTATK